MDRFGICFLIFVSAMGPSAIAQQIGSRTGASSVGSTYSENNSLHWSLAGPNWNARVNNSVAPPFGSSLSSGGVSGGLGFGGNGVSGALGFNFAQGSNRSMSGTSQSMTNLNGNPGSFFSGSVRPFVIGVTPVVGSYPTGRSEIADLATASQQEKLSSIAQGNLERRYEKLRSYLIRAELAETEGDVKKARANYGLALRIADEPLRSMIQTKLSQRSSAQR